MKHSGKSTNMENAARGRGGWYCGIGGVVSVAEVVGGGRIVGVEMFLPEDGGEATPDFGLSVMYGRYWTYFVISAASLNEERAPEIEGGGLIALTSSCSFTGT